MDPKLLELIQETNSLIKNHQAATEEALKKNEVNTSEHKQATEKRFADFEVNSKKIEEIEKNQAEINRNIEIIQAFQAASPNEQNQKQEKEKVLNAITAMIINGRTGENLNDFLGSAAGKEFNLMSTDSNPDGGYTVNPQIEGMKVARFFETSDVRSVANVLNTSSNRCQIDIDQDEAEADRTNERSASSGTDTPEIKQVTIDVHKYDAEPTITHEQAEDSYFNGEAWLNKKAFDRIARYQNTDYVTGAGVAGARGLLSYSAWTTENTYEYGKVEQLAGAVSAGFTADEVIELMGKLKSQYMNKDTIMAMNRRTFFEHLILKKNGFGDYLFLDNLKDAISGMKFLGVPIKLWDDMPVVASSSLSILIGDLKQSYDIRDKPGTLFIRDMVTDKSRIKLYTASRSGGGVTNFEGIKILKCGA